MYTKFTNKYKFYEVSNFFGGDWIGLSKIFRGTSLSDQYEITEAKFTLWSEKKKRPTKTQNL